MRKILAIATILLACFAIGYLGSKHLTVTVRAAASVKAPAFTAWQTTTDRTGHILEQRITAQRSDGSLATVHTNPDFPASGNVRTVEWIGGGRETLFDAVSAKLTGRVTQQEVAGRKYLLEHTPANCVLNGEKAGNEPPRTVEGLTAYQVESGPWTFWRAPALGCFPIAVTLASTGATVSLTKLEIGEPDAVYFDPGDSFKSAKPSELPTLFDPNFKPSASISEKLSKADAAWQQRQQ